MVFLALNTPGILFGAYVCCVVTLAGFVLNTTPRNAKLNLVSFVYLGIAAVSSLHTLFCESFRSPNELLSPSKCRLSGVSQFLLSHATFIRDHDLSPSSLLEVITTLAHEWWGCVQTRGPYNQS